MKLISCYVSSFGKLKDFSLQFNEQLNTIKEDNGWGKSTLATFIKAMFYGISSSKRNIAENERMKYKPWNSTEKFGGHIVFDWGNKRFKIERYFGNKESEDVVRLFDEETGKEFSNTDNLGKRIFEIDEDGFFSTTYLSQKDFEIKSNSSLTAKFNSVCENQDTDAFDKAMSAIEDKIKTYKYRGDKGLIPDAKREISSLDENIEKTQQSLKIINILKADIEQLEKDSALLKNEMGKLTDEINKAGDIQAIKIKKEHFNELMLEQERIVSKLKEIDKIVNGNQISSKEIENYIICNNDLKIAQSNIDSLKNDIISLKNTLKPVKETNSKKQKNIFIGFAIMFAIMGIGLSFVNIFIGMGNFALALVFGGLFFINKDKKEQISEDIGVLKLIEGKQAELDNILSLEKKTSEQIDRFISLFNIGNYINRYDVLNTLSKLVDEKEALLDKLDNLRKKLKEYSQKDIDSFNDKLDENCDIEKVKNDLKTAQNKYSNLSNELASKKANLTYHENIANNIIDLENRRDDLISKLKAYQDEHQLYSDTLQFLNQANESLKIKYRAPLQDSLNKYLTYVDGTDNAQIDIDLNISVQEKDGNKHTDYYSKGYQNLYDICKRFALTDVLFTGEKPFMILDDPFYNLDDNKLIKALELIKKLSQDYQIIYLVCHESRRG